MPPNDMHETSTRVLTLVPFVAQDRQSCSAVLVRALLFTLERSAPWRRLCRSYYRVA